MDRVEILKDAFGTTYDVLYHIDGMEFRLFQAQHYLVDSVGFTSQEALRYLQILRENK